MKQLGQLHNFHLNPHWKHLVPRNMWPKPLEVKLASAGTHLAVSLVAFPFRDSGFALKAFRKQEQPIHPLSQVYKNKNSQK